MSTFIDRLGSPRLVRRFTWVSALVLVAGVVAVSIAYFGNTAESLETPLSNQPAQGVEPQKRTVPLDTRARVVAGQFILTAVQRDVPAKQLRANMAKAWKITAPGSDVRYCGDHLCSYKEWLTGEVSIVPYPANAVDKASFAIEESYADRAALEVALLPKDGAGVKPQIFKIVLVKKGRGQNARWLVEYWAPRAINPVPVAE